MLGQAAQRSSQSGPAEAQTPEAFIGRPAGGLLCWHVTYQLAVYSLYSFKGPSNLSSFLDGHSDSILVRSGEYLQSDDLVNFTIRGASVVRMY